MDQSGFDASDSYIAKVVRDIVAWKGQTPGVFAYAVGIASAPISLLVRTLIPNSAIQGALSGADWVAKNTTTEAAQAGNDFADFKLCDTAVDQVINFHIGIAIAEGGAAGFFGLPALVVDVPAIVMLALREIRQVGIEYGYGDNRPQEQEFVLSVLAAASANSQKEKAAAVAASAYLMNMLAKETWKKIIEKAAVNPLGAAAGVIGVKNLAKQLGINITKRSALAAIPIIGAAVGASANGWFIKDVGIAAQRLYQERWLKDHGRWIDDDPAATGSEPRPEDPQPGGAAAGFSRRES